MARGRYPGFSHTEAPGLGQAVAQGGAAPPPSKPPRVIAEDYYIYAIQFEDLAFQSTQTGFIQIEADSDFLIQKLAYFSELDGSAITWNTIDIPLVVTTIVDTGSGRQLMNRPIPIPSFFGDGRLPYILPTPKLFVKTTRINVNVSNFSTATSYRNLWLSFEGKKIFTSG